MADLYLKNSTANDITINDLGYIISAGQSITIDANDIDGYLTPDMIAALATDLGPNQPNPAGGLILSTTDIPNASGDLPNPIAIEALTLKEQWKFPVTTVANLPLLGNVDGDVRLVMGSNILYRWNQATTQWVTITPSLAVTEYDGTPFGNNINELVFVQAEDAVYIDATTAYIGAPPSPIPLTNGNLVLTGASLYTGRLSQGNINYKSTDPNGSLVSYIFKGSSLTLTASSATGYDYGDRGFLAVDLNGVEIARLDLGANFNIANQTTSQNISAYNTQGAGNVVSAGVVNFVGTAAGKGNLKIISVGQYAGFKYYQTWSAAIYVTDATLLEQGYNAIVLRHIISGSPDEVSNTFDLFYDTDIGPNPVVSSLTITPNAPVYQWLSGVKYYSANSTWNVNLEVDNAFNNVYHASNAPVNLTNWPGLSTTPIVYTDATASGVSTPPIIAEKMTVTNYIVTQAVGQMMDDAKISAIPQDPYGTYPTATSASNKYLIWSYTSASTPLIENFRDEDYRLPAGAYTTIPSAIRGVWDSTQSLKTYDDTNGLQLYLDNLVFPTLNFSTYLPSGNPDYSTIASTTNRDYYRAFQDTSMSRTNGTLRLTGCTIAQLLAGKIKVFIKVPSQTGWLDLSKDFNYATYHGLDNDGCWVNRDIQTNSDFQFTLGQFYTQNSNYMIIVKIVYVDNTAPLLSYMSIIDW
jgi:hypothetical protein